MRGVRVDEEADAKRIEKAARKAAKSGDQPSEQAVVASTEALRDGLQRGERP